MKLSLIAIGTLCMMSGKLAAQSPDEMKSYMAYMAVGPNQQMMAKSAGNWTGDVSIWAKPGAPPMMSKLETTSEMILGGRFLKETNKGTMWGMPFEGIAVTGYDNARKVFISNWMDNMGTGMMPMEGTLDSVSHVLKMEGTSTNAVTGKAEPVRETIKFTDANHYLFDLYMVQDGKDVKYMEIAYTRK